MGSAQEDIAKHVKIYVFVFVGLMVLTVFTVLAWGIHLPFALAVTVALIIAIAKGSLVASFFMHLASEVNPIYRVLLLTLFFFLVLMFLPLFTYWDRVAVR